MADGKDSPGLVVPVVPERRTRADRLAMPFFGRRQPAVTETPAVTEPPEPPGLLKGEQRARLPLPKAVKVAVWERDGGRCRKCGITDGAAMLRDGEHLHYDHAWPWSLNGADTVDNIQLLCGPCNREKAARFEPGPDAG